MWTRLSILLFVCCSVALARNCYQCVGHDECAKPRNVTCDHEDFGCAKMIYDHEPYIEKGCLYRMNTQDYIKLTTCTRKHVPNTDTKFWLCGCMGKDHCNFGKRTEVSLLLTFLVFVGRIVF